MCTYTVQGSLGTRGVCTYTVQGSLGTRGVYRVPEVCAYMYTVQGSLGTRGVCTYTVQGSLGTRGVYIHCTGLTWYQRCAQGTRGVHRVPEVCTGYQRCAQGSLDTRDTLYRAGTKGLVPEVCTGLVGTGGVDSPAELMVNVDGEMGEEVHKAFIADVTGDNPGNGCYTCLQKVQLWYSISTGHVMEGGM